MALLLDIVFIYIGVGLLTWPLWHWLLDYERGGARWQDCLAAAVLWPMALSIWLVVLFECLVDEFLE